MSAVVIARRRLLLVAAAGALAMPSAFASPKAIGVPGKSADANRTIEVSMSDGMRFAPDRIEVRRGETVRFVIRNAGSTRHELVLGTARDLAAHAELMRRHPHMEHDDAHAVSVPPSESRELVWRFTKGGQVDFACLIPGHFEAGMKGRVEIR
jgi:uncharacterized cupredoxin-like copper-binding protein